MSTTKLDWQDAGDYSGAQYVQVGDYQITESALGHFFVQLTGRNSGLPIGDARMTYTLQDALRLAGVTA